MSTAHPRRRARRSSFVHANGLSLAFIALTLLSLLGHFLSGWAADNGERSDHGLPPLGCGEYMGSGMFLSSLFENWESEFLQMGLFVVLSVRLRQKGSSESKPLDEQPERKPYATGSKSPWPVRRGGLWLRFYEHSLSLALFGLFLVSFVGHWCGSYRHYIDEEHLAQRPPGHGLWGHLGSSQFWFESFQNWQSEFFSIATLVLLSIHLREKNSAQSKPVDAPHEHTGP